jgi:hypothetical protein
MPAMRQLVIPSVAVAFVVLTACSTGQGGQHVASVASGGTTAATRTTDPGDAQHKYYQCLQQQGVNIPQPQGAGVNSGAGVQGADPGVDAATLQKAVDKCRRYLPNGGQPATADPQQIATLLKRAQCMRAHGIDIADPTPDQQQMATIAIPPGVTAQQFSDALQICSQATGAGR